MSKPKVTVMGLGVMGAAMARRALEAGFELTLFNRRIERADELVKAGARAARTPKEAAEGADIILSMLSDDDASRSVWTGEEGALAGVARGAVLVESSTVTVQWIRELHAAAAKVGCELLDAPVTGSKPQANAGELVFFVGGVAAALEKARPVLAAMSRGIVHLGPSGSGALLKLINNFQSAVQVTAFAEAIAMIEQSGLDPEKALSALLSGSPGSPIVKTIAGRMTAKAYEPNFALKLLAKDVRYAIKEAKSLSLDLKTAPSALAVLQQAIDAGHGDQDMASVVEVYRRES